MKQVFYIVRNISFYALHFFYWGLVCVRIGGNNRSHLVIENFSVVIVEDKRHMKWRALYIGISE